MIAMVLHSLNSLLSAYGTFSENRAVLIGSLVLRCQNYWKYCGYIGIICEVPRVLGDPGRRDRDLPVRGGGEQAAHQGAGRRKI